MQNCLVILVMLSMLVGGGNAQTCTGASGPCIGGTCPAGFSCIGGANCCPICSGTSGQTEKKLAIPACIGGLCPAGFTCGDGVDCCPLTTTTTTTTLATTTVAACQDLAQSNGISTCPNQKYLCNNTIYYTLMTQQCPFTCGRCSSTSATTVSTCADLPNSNGGASTCPSQANLCTNTIYLTLMKQQCPKTCGYCTG